MNLSEGRRPEVGQAVRQAVQGCKGVELADLSEDADHHRQVISMLGDASGLKKAVLRIFEIARRELDISRHSGVHPRIGAVDVVPFVPLEGAEMSQAIKLAVDVAETVAELFELPIYLYEEAACRPERRRLPDVRRGQFEGLAERLLTEEGAPDFGPRRPHPRLGASIVGARRPLAAYNVVLDTSDLEAGKVIARAVRSRLAAVRVLPMWLESRSLVQISMNLTDPRQSGLWAAFEAVSDEARKLGVSVVSSELIGLASLDVLLEAARGALKLDQLDPVRVVEWHRWKMGMDPNA